MTRLPLVRSLIAILLTLGVLIPALGSATAQETTTGLTAFNPVPLETTATVGNYEITVLKVMPDAADYILAFDEFNRPPEAGIQFFLARLRITYIGATSGTPILNLGFSASTGAAADEEAYTDSGYSCGNVPEGDYAKANELFTGGIVEFNVCWAIDAADASALVMQVVPYYSSDEPGIWFSLGNAPIATPEPGSTGLKTSTDPVSSSRTEPLPIGESNLVGRWAVEVVNVELDATDQFLTDNASNDPPAEGNQFVMVTVSVTNHGEEPLLPGWELSFEAVGDNNIGYDENINSCGYFEGGSYDAPELAPGESAEFNVCWQVPSAEAPSLVMYVDAGYDTSTRAWFAIQP